MGPGLSETVLSHGPSLALPCGMKLLNGPLVSPGCSFPSPAQCCHALFVVLACTNMA